MRSGACRASSALSLVAAVAFLFGVTEVHAAEFRHMDGIHRIGKQQATRVQAQVPPQITEAAVLFRRDDLDVEACGSSMLLCPSSVGGGCCPEGFECASQSCYATTRGPSTCGTRVGWYACPQEAGGGCCPDGYICETGDACVPPSGEPYTQSCPASYSLCPASMSYGCCPDGMACAVNQCYSTEPVTVTSEVVITTTEDGDETVITTETVEVSTPDAPTHAPDFGDDLATDLVKYFPSVVAKVSQSAYPTDDADNDEDRGGGGLTTGALVGIVCGAVAFLVLVAVGAFIIIRHLNKVVAKVSESKQSDSSRSRPPNHKYKPTYSEVDQFGVDPLLMSPTPSDARFLAKSGPTVESYRVTPSPDMIDASRTTNDHTPSSFNNSSNNNNNAYASRNTSMDTGGISYFDPQAGAADIAAGANNGRTSQQTVHTVSTGWRVSADSHPGYTHVRQFSNASETSDDAGATIPPTYHGSPQTATELEARAVLPELAGSPTSFVSPLEEQRRRSGSSISSATGGIARLPAAHQRKWSGQGGGGNGRNGSGGMDVMGLGVVNEEAIHGYYGPPDLVNGQTDKRPSTGGSREPPSER